MRKRSFAPGILFLVIALAIPAFIIAQQTRSARRTTDRPAPSGATSTKASRTGAAIKSDLAEALAVIQSNHIDGRKLDYNSIFKSSISSELPGA